MFLRKSFLSSCPLELFTTKDCFCFILTLLLFTFKILKNEPEVEDVRFHGHDHLCRCHLKSGESTEAVKQCSEAIRIRGDEEPRLYCDRAEAYLDDDMYDEVNSFSKVFSRVSGQAGKELVMAKKCSRIDPLQSSLLHNILAFRL